MKLLIVLLLILAVPVTSQAKKWYEGGTLHNASALVWQNARYENKLATCSDIIVTAWKNHYFKPELQSKLTSLDSVKLLANELVKALDIAFSREADPNKNKMMYTNQTVSDSAALLMVMMGWVDL